MLRTTVIRKHETGLLFRDGELLRVLPAGRYRWIFGWRRLRRVSLRTYRRTDVRFTNDRLDVLVDEPDMAAELKTVDLLDHQRGIAWVNGRIREFLEPGLHAFWNGPAAVEIECFDVREPLLVHDRIQAILNHPGGAEVLDVIQVRPQHNVVLFRDGNVEQVLKPGVYPLWRGAGKYESVHVDLREQSLDVAGQEIMTADKVTLRVNLLVNYRVVDVLAAVTESPDFAQALYREAQLALRAAIGRRKIDELLADKDAVGSELEKALRDRS